MKPGTASRNILGTLLWCVTVSAGFGIGSLHADPVVAEASYQEFLSIYRKPQPTQADFQAALTHIENANREAPDTYKYVFGLGALHTTLENWEAAIGHLSAAKLLAPSADARQAVEVELEYCRNQLAKLQVAAWEPDSVRISFVMKKGTVEMSEDTIAKLPKALPDATAGTAPTRLQHALSDRLGLSQRHMDNLDGYLVVALDDDRAPAEHHRRGIADFHRYFRTKFFTQAPQGWITVVIAERPRLLIRATQQLYPSVQLPQYAPFLGYYNPSDNLIMATGGRTGYGTLLHEMVHALMAADFPDAPAWLNEGMASLYERTRWQGNKLTGLPNWRLNHMRAERVRSLATLAAEAEQQRLHGGEIAEYRLLMLFLDEKDLLDDLYLRVKQAGADFSLPQTLAEMALTESDWRAFLQQTFAAYQTELARSQGALSHPDEVRFVQQALKLTVSPTLTVDGQWGQQTTQALELFQRTYKLTPDGVLGPKTAAELKRQHAKARLLSSSGQ